MLKLISAAALAVFGLGAHAATFNASTVLQGETCDAGTINSSTRSEASCDITGLTEGRQFQDQPFSFTARAISEPGRLGVDGSLSVGDGNFTDRNTVNGFAIASLEDTLFFGIDTGTALISVDLAGSQSTGSTSGLNWAGVSSFLFVNVNGRIVYSNDVMQSPVVPENSEMRGSLGTTELSFGFNGGELSLSASLRTDLECDATGGNNICGSSADFFNSIRFVGAAVFDDEGNRVNTSVSSSSGFDYLVGMEPHATPVPLPASMSMLGLCLVGLFGFSRRWRRATLVRSH